jgi:MFS family permease
MDYERAARRITGTLFVTQSMASAALIAQVTIGAIASAQLGGSIALAGLPTTVVLIGAAAAAYPAGRFMQRFGRRPGLALGFLFGMIGMLLDAVALIIGSFALFIVGLILIGFARGVTDQSRYAAADAVTITKRARAISVVVFAGTVGAIGGPLLVGPLGRVAVGLNLPELAGPLLGSAALFLLGGALIVLFLRPDPRQIALAMSRDAAAAHPTVVPEAARSVAAVLRQPAAVTALIAMVLGQAVMVLVMSVTSVHMDLNGHSLDAISLVIGAHTLGMFGLSMVTGSIADRFGRPQTIVIGALLLIAGSLIAPLSLQTVWLALGLFLVGVGWNLCYIAGSSLLADSIMPSERGRVQGASDLLVNLGSAAGSLSSGVILAATGYTVLCILAALFSLVPLAVALTRMRAVRRAEAM